MEIRRGRTGDVERLVELGAKFWEFTRYSIMDDMKYSKESVRQLLIELLTGSGYILVVEEDGEIQGFGLMVYYPLIWNRDVRCTGELAYYLEPEMRGTGAGIKLLKDLEKVAKRKKIRYIAMISMDHSMDVGPLYERLGYTRTETTYTKAL